VWHWTYDTAASLSKVTDVECWSPMMMEFHSGLDPAIAWLTVLRELEFGPIHVTLPNDRVQLNLTKEFFVRGFRLDGGTNPGDQNSWWPLSADVDVSFLSVFAFDVTDATSTTPPEPVPANVVDSDGFMPVAGGAPGPIKVPAGKTGVVALEPRHRVCVCVSLVCTRQRADFEPGAIVGVGRLVPHVMVMGSRKTDRFEVELQLNRPPKSGYFGTFKNPNPPRVMEHGDMDTKMGALVVTDTNDFRSVDQAGTVFNFPLNLPYWDLIFDYVRPDVPDEFVKANVRFTASTLDSRGTRTFKGRAKVLDYSKLEKRVSIVKAGLLLIPGIGPLLALLSTIPSDALESILARASLRLAASGSFSVARSVLFGGAIETADFLPRKSLTVRKIQRQADFDSIHVAPRMIADKLLAEDTAMQDAKWKLSSIAMAPFCEHDCLHTHWRWGENWTSLKMKPLVANKVPLAGFSASTEAKFKGTGKPYQVIGNTMVPLNQKVEIAFNAAGTGFTYFVEADNAEAGVWQVANHHGSAYALAITEKGKVGAVTGVIASRGIDRISELYWNMRFQATTTAGPLERLAYDPGDLRAVIDG
jgi:hypothetical protein